MSTSTYKKSDETPCEIIKKTEDKNVIDQILLKSHNKYLTSVEHAIRTSSIYIDNYIIVFEVIQNDDGCDFKIKDIILFYIDNSDSKRIEYKNLKKKYYYVYNTDITEFKDIEFEDLVKGGIFDKYGFVSKNNACYDITKPSDYECLYYEFDSMLSKW
jgi:hypothetical protein